MNASANRKALIAVDLGAQSCRVSLLRRSSGNPEIQLIHRFDNGPLSTGAGLRWNADEILDGVLKGIALCGAGASEGIASIAVDGWAVDYVRLGSDGSPVAPPFCYRDVRNEAAASAVHAILPPARLYELTGIQILKINTLYQLYADKLAGYDPHLAWLNLPEYLTYRFCGRRIAEYTNATHTGLVKLGTPQWCQQIFHALGLELSAAPPIVPSGSVLGPLSGDLALWPALRGTQMIAAACHDTAAAIAGIPARGRDWAFISSGTWSLVGTVLDTPCVSLEAQAHNFTNLGAAGGKYCFLKNVNGMWLLRQCMDEWEQRGHRWTLIDLLAACAALPKPAALIDVDDPQLMTQGNMPQKINAQLARRGLAIFSSDDSAIPAIANTIFHSMAERYAEVLSSIAAITGKKLRRLFIVGGGSQNTLLNRLTAERTGLEIVLGSVESTTIGNFAIQLAALECQRNASNEVTADSVSNFAELLAGCIISGPAVAPTAI
jgi:rhamnulokinase